MATSSQSQHRCVFVGNIPYDATEEQLIQICEEVGPVVSFRLVIDRETGKPKGYGFCEYKDEETALSARRNLQGCEINGRQLRVDFAENDKNAGNREQGRGGPGNVDPQRQAGVPGFIGDPSLHQPIGDSVAMAAATLMAGALGAPQTASMPNQIGPQSQSLLGTDPLTRHLAKMSKSHLTQIVSEMKGMATQNKEQARQLLLAIPNLSKALFQAQIMLGMVSHQMLQVPGIRQSSAQPLQPVPQSAQTLPGLPPLPQNKMQSSLLPYLQEIQLSSGVPNQYAVVPQVPKQPQIQRPQPLQNQRPIASGVSVLPQLLAGPSSNRPHIPVPTSSSLNPHVRGTLLQDLGQVPPPNSGYNNAYPITQNGTARPPALFHPQFSNEGFQPRSSVSSAIPDKFDPKVHGLTLSGKTRVIDEDVDQMNRASKLAKVIDVGAMPSSEPVNYPVAVSAPIPTSDNSARQMSVAEQTPTSDKQVTQMELPADVDSTLLQQVLNLTPEQLSSLPPDQLQQVLQLQQLLRQAA